MPNKKQTVVKKEEPTQPKRTWSRRPKAVGTEVFIRTLKNLKFEKVELQHALSNIDKRKAALLLADSLVDKYTAAMKDVVKS